MDWEQQAKLWKGNPARQLEQLAADPGTAGWFLYRATPEIQQWFRDSRLPSVVLGPCHAGITLPSVQADVAALGRHMAAESARLGHRHLAFAVFDPGVASSLNTLEGLRRITLTNGQPGRISVVSDDGTTAGLRRALALLMKEPDPPTMIMVTAAAQSLPVQGILRQMNLRVPEDVSLAVRDHEPFLRRSVPELSRYQIDWARFGRTAAGLLMEIVRGGGGRIAQRKLLPEFVRGETLATRRPD